MMWPLIALLAVLIWVVLLVARHKRWFLPSDGDTRPIHKVNLGTAAGVRSIQGSRAHMEDTYQAAACAGGDEKRAFFGVYDGHGGHRASDFTAEHLHELILNNPQHKFEEEPVLALESGFKQLDQNWLTLATRNNWDDGTTAITVLICDGTIYVANVGDSRAVLSNNGKAVDMSHDHKPIREDEKHRIEKLGGRIIHYGTWRVEGVLAVTRAIGDRRLKKYVSAVPEIKQRQLKEGDDYLILATDGVWDVLSSQTAVDIVQSCPDRDMNEAARRVADTAFKRGSLDNITALVVDLRKYRLAAGPSQPVSAPPSNVMNSASGVGLNGGNSSAGNTVSGSSTGSSMGNGTPTRSSSSLINSPGLGSRNSVGNAQMNGGLERRESKVPKS